MPAFTNAFSLLFGTGSVKDRLKRINSCQSMASCSAQIPLSVIRRTQSTTSAAPTRTFLGSHPRSAHVPPNGLESMTATCQPAERHRDATADAAAPVPITTRSNFLVMSFSAFRSEGESKLPLDTRQLVGHLELRPRRNISVHLTYRCFLHIRLRSQLFLHQDCSSYRLRSKLSD